MSAWIEELVPPPDPRAACAALEGLPGRLLLDSADGAGFSYLMADPWEVVREGAEALRRLQECLDALRAERIAGLPPFQGGAAGMISYEWGAARLGVGAAAEEALLPPLHLGLYDWVIAWDHGAGRCWLISTGMPEQGGAAEERGRERGRAVLERLRAFSGAPPRARSAGPRPPETPPLAEGPLRHPLAGAPGVFSSHSKEGYLAALERILEAIAAGRIRQLNLSQRFEARLRATPWQHYLRLRERTPAPYAAFLEMEEAALMSASPECFLRLSEGRVASRPIKGTRPRGATAEADRRLAAALAASEKERDENRLVAALVAEELRAVCTAESVRIATDCALEAHPTVHHLVSTVEGALAPGRSVADLLEATLPPASIAGAPKRSALELLAEVEPVRRGAYCGTLLWWSRAGELESSVLIRTMVAVGERLFYAAGGGITGASVPEEEYQETLDKARAFLETLR